MLYDVGVGGRAVFWRSPAMRRGPWPTRVDRLCCFYRLRWMIQAAHCFLRVVKEMLAYGSRQQRWQLVRAEEVVTMSISRVRRTYRSMAHPDWLAAFFANGSPM